MKPRQYVLLCPGPVNVTSAVRKAAVSVDLCHREPEFSDLQEGVRRKLLTIFGISKTHTVALVGGSGTAALEAMILSAVRPEEKLLVVDNGIYGERIYKIAAIHNIPAVRLQSSILEQPNLEVLENALRRDARIGAVAMVQHETSTGLLNPVEKIAALTKRYGKTFALDGISSLGAEELSFDGIGLCAGSAGKCLHGFPGFSFVLVSKAHRRRLSSMTRRSFYLDLAALLDSQEQGEPLFTPAVQLILGLNAALDDLLREGLRNRIRMYRMRSRYLRDGYDRLGFVPLLVRPLQCHTLTALRLPKRVSYEKIHDRLKKDGFVIYAGQSRLRREIFRISHMGQMTIQRMDGLLHSLAKVI
ncbi:MAG: alanine--glyoxylate aminotransferase family protein [Candidatus Omnitrophica bacterium]|nr:alanine--glyoxylate aminotransferase family protein [Candidatus Omnitrophota bacterium]